MPFWMRLQNSFSKTHSKMLCVFFYLKKCTNVHSAEKAKEEIMFSIKTTMLFPKSKAYGGKNLHRSVSFEIEEGEKYGGN